MWHQAKDASYRTRARSVTAPGRQTTDTAAPGQRSLPSDVSLQKGLSNSAKFRLFLRVTLSASSLHRTATIGTNESWTNSCTDWTHCAISEQRQQQQLTNSTSRLSYNVVELDYFIANGKSFSICRQQPCWIRQPTSCVALRQSGDAWHRLMLFHPCWVRTRPSPAFHS